MSQRRHFAVQLLCLLTLFCAASTLSAAEDDLLWRGDHATGRVIMEDLAKQYAKEKKGKITLQPFSTVSGLDAVAQGTADIAGSARGKYAKRAEESGVNFVPVALDGAVLITHPRNPVGSVTLRQVYDIYYGRITNWKELGGEDKPINLYGIAAPLDGVEFSVRDLVFRNGDQRVAVPRLYLNTTKLEEGVAIDPAGLGLSTYASTVANPGVKPLAIEGISASTATIADGSYPLYITLYLAERVDSPKQAAIDRFIAFLDTPPAKDILKKHGLVPYSEATDAIARASARTAFIDSHLGREPGTTVGSVAAASPAPVAAVTPAPVAASVPPPTPVAAPRASLEAKTRVSPTSETAEQARANLAAAEEKKAAKAAATAAANADKPAPKKKAAVAKAEPKPKAAKPASFDNVAADAKTAAKPASFGDVNAGAKSTDDPNKH